MSCRPKIEGGTIRLSINGPRLKHMRLFFWLFIATLAAVPAHAQEPSPSSPATSATAATSPIQDAAAGNLPVSIERIRAALEQQPTRSLFATLPNDQPTFRVEVKERNRLQDLVASLDFRGGPTPAGGLYAAEMQRVMFPTTSNPLQQPYAAFSQSELLTVLVENLAGKYLGGRALSAVTSAERARAEAAAREEVRHTIADYCTTQPGAARLAMCAMATQ